MLFAIRTSITMVEVLPKRIRVKCPVLAHSLVAALANRPAIGLTAVLQQSVPAIGIVGACWTFPVTARVLDVEGEAVLCLEAALAPVAVSGNDENGGKAMKSGTYAAASAHG